MNIERMQPADFDAVYRLLTQSFPATERRGAAGQRALFSDSAYRVDILRAPDGGVQALIASWDFDDFVFLEHFAVDPACRSGGIGGQMLDAMLARCGKRACLEAELPETELAARRIGFYERHGFTVNADYAYFQPALVPGRRPAADAPAHDRWRMHKRRAARDGDARAHARVRANARSGAIKESAPEAARPAVLASVSPLRAASPRGITARSAPRAPTATQLYLRRN